LIEAEKMKPYQNLLLKLQRVLRIIDSKQESQDPSFQGVFQFFRMPKRTESDVIQVT